MQNITKKMLNLEGLKYFREMELYYIPLCFCIITTYIVSAYTVQLEPSIKSIINETCRSAGKLSSLNQAYRHTRRPMIQTIHRIFLHAQVTSILTCPVVVSCFISSKLMLCKKKTERKAFCLHS